LVSAIPSVASRSATLFVGWVVFVLMGVSLRAAKVNRALGERLQKWLILVCDVADDERNRCAPNEFM
jgi:hypothetical protein